MKKGLKGLKEDNVLPLLTGDTKAMHDHNINSRLDKILQHGWQEYEADKDNLSERSLRPVKSKMKICGKRRLSMPATGL